jgi:hypothetical protein
MTATPNFASDALSVGAGDAAVPASNAGPFVLNLCSSTTPMALAQTDLPELKRFTFFVSRRFEEGRERFRLHMGYFATLAESEEWLSVVREIYPGAWAGEAPGRKLRERATAAQAAQAQHAAGPQQQVSTPRPAPAPTRPVAPAPTPPTPAEALSMRVPVLKAAPAATPAAPVAKPPVAKPAAAKAPPVRSNPVQPTQPAAPVAPTSRAPAPQSAPRPMAAPAPAQKSAVPAQRTAPAANAAQAPQKLPAAAKTAPPAAHTPSKDEKLNSPEKAAMGAKGAFGDSNVREVLKALGDASATGETRLMRAPLAPPAKETAVSAPAAKPPSDISDTQVLRLLETRRAEGASEAPPAQDPAHGAIPLLKPDDTGTREALKDAVSTNAPVLFAVQLQWSVQAVELDKVPPLAIFSAYTLYTVEGSRDGRKWYGLRLGFFSDAISAKQVAHYVRSEFTSVAVVPVSSQEKSRATDQDKQAATLGAPAATRAPVDEFKLIDDDTAAAEVAKMVQQAPAPAAAKPLTDAAGRKIPGRPIPKVAVGRTVIQPATLAAAPATQAPAKAPAPPKPAGRSAGKVGAREKRGPQSLEETLEILGAGQLSIDNGTGATLNDSGVRHLRVEVQKNSPFSKLLERLSERMKKS